MTSSFIASQWETMCQSARSNASGLIHGASRQAAELMQAESDRFCSHEPPRDKDALESIYTRRMALSARLTAIARADAMARAHPKVAADILSQVRRFCEDDLPASSDIFLEMQLRNIELTRTVAGICEADMVSQAT